MRRRESRQNLSKFDYPRERRSIAILERIKHGKEISHCHFSGDIYAFPAFANVKFINNISEVIRANDALKIVENIHTTPPSWWRNKNELKNFSVVDF